MSLNMVTALERTKYNDEFKYDFERDIPLLKQSVRTDGLLSAGTVKWDVIDPAERAQKRTRDGDIPRANLGLSQVSGTPEEYFSGDYRVDNFDLFRSNPNYRMAQAKKAISAINQQIDQTIIDQLDTATNQVSASAAALSALATVSAWRLKLRNRNVPFNGQIWAAITPAASEQMMRISEYKSHDFVDVKPAIDGARTYKVMHWMDVNWIVHTGLTGVGTAVAKCYMWHESAIGHQMAGDPETMAYYDEKQDRYGTWAKVWMCAKMCLQRGVEQFLHDDTAALT